jgi:acetyl esterase/lipase
LRAFPDNIDYNTSHLGETIMLQYAEGRWSAARLGGFLIAIWFTTAAMTAMADEAVVLDLWPNGTPTAAAADVGEERELQRDPPDGVMRLTGISRPQITVFRPAKPNGSAVLVAPGGGYQILAYEHEGSQVCSFLNDHGVTAILLKYRVPAARELGLQDAQRAMGLIHHHAEEWGIDRERIGMLGFSAGGHLTVMTCLHGKERTYEIDPAYDVEDPTPAFAVPVYPAYLVERGSEGPLLDNVTVTASSPPLCLIHAADDPWTSSGSSLLAVEYKKHGIPCEVHIYAKGGHGFGMKKTGFPVDAWPHRVVEWMESIGLFSPSASTH